MSNRDPRNRKLLATLLPAVFLFALLMGPGPGIYLVNPDPGDPDATRSLFGMPIIWLWSVLWFFVEAACIITAYNTLWKDTES